MRNLKRVLALAMAMVMILGMMVIGSSAAKYSDEAAISAEYADAVEILSGMGVFKGTGAGFAPKQILTRAEAAALIYRVITGDVADKQVANYDYASLKDVKAGDWFTGYVTYANNGGYIKGDDAGNFNPYAQVTGIQVMAIMLRAAGYGQNGEYEGAAWKDNILTDAKELGITGKIATSTLNAPATRELVAQLIFNAITSVDMVTYAPALGYIKPIGKAAENLSEKVFGLDSVETCDPWGRPCVDWFDARKGQVKGYYATIEEEALATYTTAVTECQIATDTGLKVPTDFVMYTNGVVNASAYEVQPLDTVQRIGSQGTLVEVYEDEIVVISTFLAEVLKVNPARYDAAGHKASNASIELYVYDADTNTQGTTKNVVVVDAFADFTYAKGDMVLVNAYTNNVVNTTSGAVTVGTVATTSVNGTPVADYAEILGVATAQVGAQTFHWYNAPKHTIDGVNYDDAAELHLDEAVYSTAKYTWYFDQYGNLIGSTDIATTYTFGIIEQIQWINPIGTAGYAQATIRYMDGTTAEAVIASVNGEPLEYAQYVTTGFPAVSTNLTNNKGLLANDLFRISVNVNGTLALEHVFTDVNSDGNNWNSTTTAGVTTYALDANELNHIAGVAINPWGTGVNALSAITNGNADGTVYANANTVFLVRNVTKTGAYTFEVITGYQNMPEYETATIDWVKTNNDSYVDFVYVTGTPADADPYYGLFYLNTTAGIQGVLNARGTAVDYYVVSGILDGVAGTYKVAADANFKANASAAFTTITMADFGKVVSELSYVLVDGDEITEVWDTSADSDYLLTKLGTPKYKDLYLDIHTARAADTTPAVGNTVTKNGDVLCVDGVYYTVNGMEAPVVGAWADDMSGKTVYVIYDSTKSVTVGAGKVAYVAKAVYIVSGAAGITNSGDGTPDIAVVDTPAEFIAAVANDGVVVLADDITLTSALTISKNVTITAAEAVTITTSAVDALKVTGTLTLGENVTIAGADSILWANGGTVNIEGANLVSTGTVNALGFADNGGVINMKSGSVKAYWTCLTASGANSQVNVSGGTAESSHSNVVLAKDGATATISGGTTTIGTPNYAALWAKNNGKLVVTGGTISGVNAISVEGNAVATVSGGVFTGTLAVNSGASMTISGGFFNDDPSTFVAGGYQVEQNGTWWKVTAWN